MIDGKPSPPEHRQVGSSGSKEKLNSNVRSVTKETLKSISLEDEAMRKASVEEVLSQIQLMAASTSS